MRQGRLEGDKRNIKRERSEIETLIFAEGRHVLCSSDIVEVMYQAKPLEKETASEEDIFRAIHLL